MWYFLPTFAFAIGRMLVRSGDPVLIDPGEHVRRPANVVIDDPPRVAQPRGHAVDELARMGVHRDQGVALHHARAHLRLDDESRRRVDAVLLADPTGAELDEIGRASCR